MEPRTTTAYLIFPTGEIYRQAMSEVPINVTDESLAPLMLGLKLKASSVWLDRDFNAVVSACLNCRARYYTVNLPELCIQAPYKLVEKVMVPQFNSKSDPVIPMKWIPPEDCHLKYLAMIQDSNVQCEWLMALDNKGLAWRLPLPNVYEDCRVCTGEYPRFCETDQHGVNSSLRQFRASNWNQDLWSGQEERSQKMFRFLPNKKEGFEQLQPDGNWTKLCVKVGIPQLQYLV